VSLAFLLFNREAGALPWLGIVGETGPLALWKQVSWHLQNGWLPLSGRAEFLLFEEAVGALPQECLVVSLGPPLSVGKETSWCQQNSKVWSLGFICVCGHGLLALSNKLRVPVWQQSCQSWIIWCPQVSRVPKVYLCWGHGLPGSTAAATGMGDPRLWEVGTLGSACQCGFQEPW
jgi:hypothetical protein